LKRNKNKYYADEDLNESDEDRQQVSFMPNSPQHHLHQHEDTKENSLANSVINLAPSKDFSKFYFTYDYENGSGELYMRVGTAIFAMATMIDRCLSLVQMIETYFNNHSAIEECRITFIVSIVAKTTSIVFIFMQSFFIFKYANIIINYGKNSAVIGLMHIVCTNFCVFFRTVVMEAVAEIRHHHRTEAHKHAHSGLDAKLSASHQSFMSNLSEHSQSSHDLHVTKSVLTTKMLNATGAVVKPRQLGCINTLAFNTEMSMGITHAQDRLSPYLYPCIIEYSLMCMTVFYILWSSIEQRYSANNHFGAWGNH
jgi:hypothetical protein